MWVWVEAMHLYDGDAFTLYTGQYQHFDVQYDELWVYVIEWQGVKWMLTAPERCDVVFEWN